MKESCSAPAASRCSSRSNGWRPWERQFPTTCSHTCASGWCSPSVSTLFAPTPCGFASSGCPPPPANLICSSCLCRSLSCAKSRHATSRPAAGRTSTICSTPSRSGAGSRATNPSAQIATFSVMISRYLSGLIKNSRPANLMTCFASFYSLFSILF